MQSAKHLAKYKILRFCGPNVVREWGGDPETLKKEEWKPYLLNFHGFRHSPNDFTTSSNLIEDYKNHENIILYSHEFFGEVDHLLTDSTWKKILSLRHPFSRFFSLVLQKQLIPENYCRAEDFIMFNFFYKEWYRGPEKLSLNIQNAKKILEEAKSLLNIFDDLILQENLKVHFSRLIAPMEQLLTENKTPEPENITIPHELIKWYSSYIEYDLEFFNYALKKFNVSSV